MRLYPRTPIVFSFALVCGALVSVLTGCNPPAATSDATTASSGASSSDTGGGSSSGGEAGKALVIEGSDTLLPLAQKWAEDFKKQNPDANITVSGGGSGQGIKSLINGTATIADASREADDKEKAQAKGKGFELTETAVARDGITIIVNPSNSIKSLTLAQVKDIYTGKVNNWKEIGGSDLKITASGRDSASGTYKYFQEDVLGKNEKYRADMASTPSNNAIANNVAQQKGGIGYIGVAYATEFTKAGKVREVPVAFKVGEQPVLPTSENILNGKYPISRALYNYTKNSPEGLAKSYLDYVTGPEGQKVVTEQGYVTLK
ncbi:MAG: PstS family phosphate ABC transporter substrate-binding protein [Cytophagales bacterium]|nr:PstS family phosphate ABC transporter substrate-binding protein [Armatimonadota bacterium]